MTKPPQKNAAAAELGKKRWEGVSKAEHSRLARAAIAARWKGHKKKAPKKPRRPT